jgi:hypothetical protein
VGTAVGVVYVVEAVHAVAGIAVCDLMHQLTPALNGTQNDLVGLSAAGWQLCEVRHPPAPPLGLTDASHSHPVPLKPIVQLVEAPAVGDGATPPGH